MLCKVPVPRWPPFLSQSTCLMHGSLSFPLATTTYELRYSKPALHCVCLLPFLFPPLLFIPSPFLRSFSICFMRDGFAHVVAATSSRRSPFRIPRS